MRGDIVILTGPPGAGKSTIAAALATDFERAVHLHTDDFWHYIAAGAIPPYLAQADSQNQTVLRVIAGAASTYATGGYTVIVDGIVGPWMLHHFGPAMPGTPELRMHYLVLRPSRDTALARAVARTGPDDLTAHEPIQAMWDQFADLGDMEPYVLDTTEHRLADTLDAVRTAVRDGTNILPA